MSSKADQRTETIHAIGEEVKAMGTDDTHTTAEVHAHRAYDTLPHSVMGMGTLATHHTAECQSHGCRTRRRWHRKPLTPEQAAAEQEAAQALDLLYGH